MRIKIIVRGPALSRSGYGEQCRFALRSLRAHEDKYDIYLAMTQWGKTGWVADDSEERQWIDAIAEKTQVILATAKQQGVADLPFHMSLQVTIPNEWDNKLAKVNVGYTAGIETTKVAPDWIKKGNLMDHIIVCSNHSKHVYQQTAYHAHSTITGQTTDNWRLNSPISVVNYPVKQIGKKEVELETETDFNFLVVAQGAAIRKNLINTIKWFIEEFKDDADVGLIVKTFTLNNSVIDRYHTVRNIENVLAEHKEKKCKIYILHGEMTDEEMTGLYTNKKIKALASITHGEGYGLPLFEAAYNGLPVICPDWSGQCDFLYAPVVNKKNKKIVTKPHFARVKYTMQHVQKEAIWDGVIQKDSMWCFPEEASYRTKLREVYKDWNRFNSQAKKLKKHVLKEFEQEKMYDEFVSTFAHFSETPAAKQVDAEKVHVL